MAYVKQGSFQLFYDFWPTIAQQSSHFSNLLSTSGLSLLTKHDECIAYYSMREIV